MGRRDRAILLLLARLALRAGDVANLRLHDIDWDNAVLHVSGKSRHPKVMPLPQEVVDADRDCLFHARPVVDTEKMFLRMTPSLDQSLSSPGVSRDAKAAIIRSGIQAERFPSAHVFRHSAATNLLRDSTPLEVLSTLLCHQDTRTTAIYAQLDVRMLREVALPWPMAGG